MLYDAKSIMHESCGEREEVGLASLKEKVTEWW